MLPRPARPSSVVVVRHTTEKGRTMYSKYQQRRIARGALGFQIATDAVAQRGLSLDITRIGVARWLDMRLETLTAENVEALVGYEAALQEVINEAMEGFEPGHPRAQHITRRLEDIAEQYVPTDSDRRARFNLFDSIRRADHAYGREHVAAFVAEYHPHAVALLDAVKASA
ncbi:hypothetical protein QDA04_gp41 [Microbacterium phage Megan]|uniref:Uncharacterized protein n=1 Tax=Microbacterium phage Megan TaxID=2656551 RepID=A0A649VKC1_9CAUD|nr:hypothetical protein QDA04_gp41 [Microbacterium phage Megan]QGJ92711.1 hypothetical protein PBI_MEGAN_41 [Microbacterium phage Megan]